MANKVDSYIDKYKGVDRPSVFDILQRVGTDKYKNNKITLADGTQIYEYEALGIDCVKIDDNTFTNYGQYQFIWEKTFVKSPERSANGEIGNLNSYATFLTPHLILNFSVMSIEDYREIMKMHYSRNEFVVKCYDPIYNQTITAKMYFATEEMAKLYTIAQNRLLPDGQWEEWLDIVGVTEYTVELIGTNNDLDLLSVIYHLNPPSDTGYADYSVGEDDVYRGEELIIGGAAKYITSETFGGKYKFTKWNVSSDNPTVTKAQGNFIDGTVYTVNSHLILYAQWENLTTHTLSYNYGVADKLIEDDQYVTSKQVTEDKSIGALPTVAIPKVEHKDINGVNREYSPYSNGHWYKTPTKSAFTEYLLDNTIYWATRDSTIYLLYDVAKYELKLYLEGVLYQTNSIEYNTPMNLPTLVKSGYKFDGWYSTADYQEGTKISENMPPYRLDLYARWIEE